MIWDSGSEWLVVESHFCNTCAGYGYDYSSADTFTIKPNSEGERNYGSASTEGFEAYETVCIKKLDSACIEEYHMFVVTAQEGLPSAIDGIAGLSTGQFDGVDHSESKTIVEAWANAGVLSKPQFAFALNDFKEETLVSSLDLGFFDEAKMSNPDDLVLFTSIPGDYWWTTTVEGVRFGDNTADAYSVTRQLGITDSGSSCLVVPPDYYSWLLDYIEDYTVSGFTERDEGSYYVDCGEKIKLPSIWILYGGHWLEVRQ